MVVKEEEMPVEVAHYVDTKLKKEGVNMKKRISIFMTDVIYTAHLDVYVGKKTEESRKLLRKSVELNN